jgi:protein-export membrane protein SecD
MKDRKFTTLAFIVVLILAVGWIDLPNNPGFHFEIGDWTFDRDIKVHQGLDLQGGLQVLLEADLPPDQEIDQTAMETARVIVENRVNGLGVVEPLVQTQGSRRIIVELPGIEDEELAIATIRETGLLEFVDVGQTYREIGAVLKTDYLTGDESSPEPTATITATQTVTGTDQVLPAPEEPVYHTVMAGSNLKGAALGRDELGALEIYFELDETGAGIFADHTAGHINQFLCILLDKQVISCPRIQTAIPDGQGRITGSFSLEEGRKLMVQLRYGALPIPLRVETVRKIGPSLGQESVQKSIRAGTVGLLIVLLFMLIYYRLLGFLADLALITYALINFAAFKLIPVTLTLPGITGFLISTGMAVDANILIFERMKEELRAGRSLSAAIRAGFDRAWTSIRDSNISTFITCAILYYFGSSFGASIVKGFAVTLFLGVAISMFTAIIVTRTFIRVTLERWEKWIRGKHWLLGI